jgi:hypothetical protein
MVTKVGRYLNYGQSNNEKQGEKIVSASTCSDGQICTDGKKGVD